MSILVPAGLIGLIHRFGRGHNDSAVITAKPAKGLRMTHAFFGGRNMVMLGILLVLALAACYALFWPLDALPGAASFPTQVSQIAILDARPLPALERYLNIARKRELFKPSVPLAAGNKLGQTTAEQLAKRFKFLGVSGAKPDLSALVAVTNGGVQTVRQGERLEDFVVKEIDSGQLVLQLNEDIVTLKR